MDALLTKYANLPNVRKDIIYDWTPMIVIERNKFEISYPPCTTFTGGITDTVFPDVDQDEIVRKLLADKGLLSSNIAIARSWDEIVEGRKMLSQYSLEENKMSLIVCIGHPAYHHLKVSQKVSWQRSEQSQALSYSSLINIPNPMPTPSNKILHELIENNILIVATFVMQGISSNILPPEIFEAFLKADSVESSPVNGFKIRQIISPFHIYDSQYWPEKNTGVLEFIPTKHESFTPVIEHPPNADFSIIATDGIVGAGKTTRIKQMEKEGLDRHFVYENTKVIYDTIQHCREHSIIGKERRRMIEDVVTDYEKRLFEKLSSMTGMIYLERNWMYTRWVFGDYISPYPIIEEELVRCMQATRGKFLGTRMIWTAPEIAIERAKNRGTQDELDIQFEKVLEQRLKILYTVPYEWAYGKLLE